VGRSAKLRVHVVLALSAIAAPASALASSGGAGLPTGSTGPATQPLTPAGVTTETVSGGGITFTTRSAALLRGTLRFSGTTASGAAGHTLVIQRQSGQSWVAIATATTTAGGSFTAAWRVNRTGDFSVRAVMSSGPGASPAAPLVVYRPSVATEYGPGLYGRKTACGAVLRRVTIGVANRNLPCGSSVSIYYRGRTVVVPVIDRGPYANGANWDLTMATGRALGISGTTTIGALRTNG
jgi:rare lipoprotein A